VIADLDRVDDDAGARERRDLVALSGWSTC
jgi:hypothetical protein